LTTPPFRPERLVVSDLDGCLLDVETYAWEPAREALLALRERGVPLIPCTSKTRRELEALAPELCLDGPWIVEGGAALVVSAGPGARAEQPLQGAVPRAALVRALEEIAAETGARVSGFSRMSLPRLEALSGLSHEAAIRAADREYDEPFVLEGPPQTLPALKAAAERRGLTLTRGARFLHLSGPADKGRALGALRRLYANGGDGPEVVALGDSPADLGMLRAAERAIVVPGRDGVDPELARALPGAERAPEAGPAGWNRALLAVLAGERLPLVAEDPRRRA
jgi:mannosyl-3-phosphoglycerate phosphatase